MSHRKKQVDEYRSRINNAPGKIAYLTIGRWQPPHKGHSVLIRKTLELAKINGGHAFVYIYSKEPSREDEWLKNLSDIDFIGEVDKFKINNPLSVNDRLHYLKKMYPENEGFPPDIFDFLIGTGIERDINDIRGKLIRSVKHGSMSLDLIAYLKKLHYSEVKIIVGSDRVEAFKKYNPDIEIIKAGDERGSVGKGDIGIISYSMDGWTTVVSKRSRKRKLPINIMDQLITDPQSDKAIEFSGSRMRDYAKTGNTRKFVEGSSIGNMTYQDCIDLMNDVREGMQLNLKLGPRTHSHIKVDPAEHLPGVVRENTEVSDEFPLGFVLNGGNFFRKSLQKRGKHGNFFRKSLQKREKLRKLGKLGKLGKFKKKHRTTIKRRKRRKMGKSRKSRKSRKGVKSRKRITRRKLH